MDPDTPPDVDEMAELRAMVTRLSRKVDALEDQLLDLDAGTTGDPGFSAPPGMADLEQYVDEVFVHMFPRQIGGQLRWCELWWRHQEAVIRLEALWRSFEACRRLDPETGTANWLRDYANPTLAELFSPVGPFAACTPSRHHEDTPLPTVPAPVGAFAAADAKAEATYYPNGRPDEELAS